MAYAQIRIHPRECTKKREKKRKKREVDILRTLLSQRTTKTKFKKAKKK